MTFYRVLHTLVLAHHAFAGIYGLIHFYFKDSTEPELLFLYKYKFRYLTMWNLWVQSFYSITAIGYELHVAFISNDKYLNQLIPKIKSYLLFSIIFPSATFVSSTFWSLYSVDPDLVFPKQLQLLIPSWYNHCIHTNILIMPFLEFWFNYRIPNKFSAFIGASLYYWVYDATCIYTYFETNKWIYKVFELLDLKTRATYMLFNYFLTVGAVYVAMYIQKSILKYKNRQFKQAIANTKIN